MKKTNHVYLRHVLDAIRKIRDYTAGGETAFLADTRTQDAVIRNLEVIGEAVKRLDPSLTAKYPEIPWKRIAGMRDKMIHDYLGVNLQIVWRTVGEELPALENRIAQILAEADDGNGQRPPVDSR